MAKPNTIELEGFKEMSKLLISLNILSSIQNKLNCTIKKMGDSLKNDGDPQLTQRNTKCYLSSRKGRFIYTRPISYHGHYK